MTEFAITNQVPSLYTDAECQMLAEAAAAALPAFCKEKGLELPTVAYYQPGNTPPSTSWVIPLLPSPTPGSVDSGVEAYHDDEAGVPGGKCFAGFLLAQGGSKWTGELAVSVAWTHEMFEMLRNPRTNLVLQNPPPAPDGKTYATLWAEVGDPAQGEHVAVTISGQEVWTAGWTTQSWEDPNGKAPYSFPSGLVKAPLTIGPQGYGGFGDASGNVSTVFAAQCHPVIQALKSLHGRLATAAGPATIDVRAELCDVIARFAPDRALVLFDGLYVLVDRGNDGAWDLSGTPANAAEKLVLDPLVAAMGTTVTVTKDS